MIQRDPIISGTSILRCLPLDLPSDQVIVLDGIRIAAQIADQTYWTLSSMANVISERGTIGEEPDSAQVIEQAWTFVDAIHRMRRLLQRAPRMKQNSPGLQIFYRNTTDFETLRHGIQHLDERIDQLIEQELPVWGEVAWIYATDKELKTWRCFVMVPGAIRSGIHPIVDFVGKPVDGPVDHIHLRAFGTDADISAAWRTTREFVKGLEAALAPLDDPKRRHGSDSLFVTEHAAVTNPEEAMTDIRLVVHRTADPAAGATEGD